MRPSLICRCLLKEYIYVTFVIESFNIYLGIDLLSGYNEKFIFPGSFVIGQDCLTSPCQWTIDESNSDMSYSVAAIVKVL